VDKVLLKLNDSGPPQPAKRVDAAAFEEFGGAMPGETGPRRQPAGAAATGPDVSGAAVERAGKPGRRQLFAAVPIRHVGCRDHPCSPAPDIGAANNAGPTALLRAPHL